MKHTCRLLLALLTSLILGLGALVAVGGTATASSGPCASQRSHVAKAHHQVKKDKVALKHAKHAKHHRAAKVKKAKKKLHKDQRHLKRAEHAFNTCKANHSGSNAGTDDSSGGSTEAPPSASPVQPLIDGCNQLAEQDPTGQFAQLCAAFASGSTSLPGTTSGSGSASPVQPLIDGCNQLAAQDPTGQLSTLCAAFAGGAGGGLPSLPGV